MFLDETAWVAIAFILFIALVWKKASKAIITILDNRSNLIQDELNEARALKEEAMEKLRQASQIQQNSTEEFEKIIKDATETAKNIKKCTNRKKITSKNFFELLLLSIFVFSIFVFFIFFLEKRN